MATAAPTVWWRRPTPVQQLSVVACRVVVQETKPSSDQFAVRQRPSPPSLASGPSVNTRIPSPSSNSKAVSMDASATAATGDQVLVHECGRRSGSGRKVRPVAEPPTSDKNSMSLAALVQLPQISHHQRAQNRGAAAGGAEILGPWWRERPRSSENHARAKTQRKRGWGGGPGIFAHTPTFEFRQSGWVSDLCVRSLGVVRPAGGAGQAEKGRKKGGQGAKSGSIHGEPLPYGIYI